MATEHRAVGSSVFDRLRRHRYIGLAVNALPAGFWLLVFFLAPLAVMLFFSFGERGAFGEVLLGLEYFGLQQYTMFFIPEGSTIPETIWITLAWVVGNFVPLVQNPAAVQPTPYVQLLFKSLYFGLVTTVVALLVGYPMAYYVARHTSTKWQTTLIALVVLPYWASYLVRVYAIKLMLAKNGLVNNLLEIFGIATDIRLLYTDFAVQYGLVYIWIPFMILPIYASLEQLNPELNEAAMDLGADRLDSFRYVTLPLSKPGVVAGSILVFIPSVGAYVIPAILGGANTATIGEFIAAQFGAAGNWPLGAAAAFILMVIMFGALWAYQRGASGDFL
jgi:spermidine/putrescine transport system permease protein